MPLMSNAFTVHPAMNTARTPTRAAESFHPRLLTCWGVSLTHHTVPKAPQHAARCAPTDREP